MIAQWNHSAVLRLCQTLKEAMPINTYKVVHTGANTQFGGLNDGLLMVRYHVFTDSMVNWLPIKPIKSGMARQIKKVMIVAEELFFVIVIGYTELTTILIKCLEVD